MRATNHNERAVGYILVAMGVGTVIAVPMCAWLWPEAGLMTQAWIGAMLAGLAVWTGALVAGVLGTAWQAYWRVEPRPRREDVEPGQLSWD